MSGFGLCKFSAAGRDIADTAAARLADPVHLKFRLQCLQILLVRIKDAVSEHLGGARHHETDRGCLFIVGIYLDRVLSDIKTCKPPPCIDCVDALHEVVQR